MGIYIRKSLKAGPFRFNFSKSGVGVSAGVAGFRFGHGPRGNYVSIGRNGVYYRVTLPGDNGHGSQENRIHPHSPQLPELPPTVEMKEIESADVLQLQDSSSTELLQEMNNKHNKPRLLYVALGISIVTLLLIITAQTPPLVWLVTAFIALAIIIFAQRQDEINKTVILFYELDGAAESMFQSLHDSFRSVVDSKRIWHISASGRVTELNEQKRQAGAHSLVKRTAIRPGLNAPPFVSTNLSIPAIPAGKQTLYFFPDRLLVYESGQVGAVAYSDIQLELGSTRFIESEGVSSDTEVVGQTWQYVNKSGGPDKRFKNNRKLPIVLYRELYLKSSSGLNKLFQLSNPLAGSELPKAIKGLTSEKTNAV